MRLYCVVLLGSLVSSAAANASSFVTLPAADRASSPSIVYLGKASPASIATAPAPAGDMPYGVALAYPDAAPPDLAHPAQRPVIVSPSIIALGEPAVSVEDFRVAAISEKPKGRVATALPMVMRGGLLGDAFVRSGPQPVAPTASEPAPQEASSSSGPPKPERKPPPQRQPEPPAAPPPPAPTGPAPRTSLPQ